MDDYGKVEVVLTAVHDPVAKDMYRELSGYAWTRLHPVPVRYPVENPMVLIESLGLVENPPSEADTIWVIGPQDIAAVGRLLGSGLPPVRRLVAIGGPGVKKPIHYSVPIGTRINHFAADDTEGDDRMVLRGGLLRGTPVDPGEAAVQFEDDGMRIPRGAEAALDLPGVCRLGSQKKR